jgi:molecular chaperone DnaK (HSP70)
MMFGRDAFECVFDHTQYTATATDLIVKTEAAVNRCLRSLGMQLKDINKFILIGGTSSSKLVYNYWKTRVSPNQELVYHQPLSSVAKGAALYAYSIGENAKSAGIRPIELKSVSTYNIGLKVGEQNIIDLAVHRNSPLPVVSKKGYQIDPSRIQSFSAKLCQFWDADSDLHELGTIQVQQFNTLNEFVLEIQIENRLNGTIGIKVRNADTLQDIRCEFIRKESNHKYDYQQQKALLDSVYVNNYL